MRSMPTVVHYCMLDLLDFNNMHESSMVLGGVLEAWGVPKVMSVWSNSTMHIQAHKINMLMNCMLSSCDVIGGMITTRLSYAHGQGVMEDQTFKGRMSAS